MTIMDRYRWKGEDETRNIREVAATCARWRVQLEMSVQMMVWAIKKVGRWRMQWPHTSHARAFPTPGTYLFMRLFPQMHQPPPTGYEETAVISPKVV